MIWHIALMPAQNAELKSEGERPVVLTSAGPDTAIVFGTQADIASIGRPIQELPQKLVQATAIGAGLVEGLVTGAELSGCLVRLTADSVAALKAFGPMTDSTGAVLGVVRNSGGQFAKVLSFTSIDGLAVAAGLAPAIAAIALQLQLQQIGKQLDRIQAGVTELLQANRVALTAAVEADRAILMSSFQLLLDTGTVGDTEWSKIAALTPTVTKHLGQTKEHVRELIQELAAIRRGGDADGSERSGHDRRRDLEKFLGKHPAHRVGLYVLAVQNTVLYEALNVFRLMSAQDQHLDRAQSASENRVRSALQDMTVLQVDWKSARLEAGRGNLSSWLPARNLFNNSEKLERQLLQLRDDTSSLKKAAATVRPYLQARPGHLALPATTPVIPKQ